ncbi:hypothetical protein HY497_01605 [Candidatus Woesearchaeota archaeon]|nr:hypothetical protein [Candidatus Woesearchaeota archaeon]
MDIPRGGLYYDIGIEYESDYRQRFKDSKSIAIEQVRPEISEESTKEDFMEESTAITEITDGTALSASVNESEEAVAPAGETLDQDEKIGLLVMGIIFFVVVGILVQVIYRKNS